MIVDNSSIIKGIDYIENTRELIIDFKTGKTYTYSNVPGVVALSFFDSESKGHFFY